VTMKLTVEMIGDRFPRYILACENRTYWTGADWSPRKADALKYASLRVIRDDWKRLQEQMQRDMGELVATVAVRILTDKPLTMEQITNLGLFLSRASTFTLDYSVDRPAELQNAVISCQIRWSTLRPKVDGEVV
jgi:hypothetical protein